MERKKIRSNSMSICIIILVTCMFIQTLQVSHLLAILWHPILRIVPFYQSSETGYVYKEFKALHYVLVSKSVVDQVYITIKTENGAVVPFVTGETFLKLHFCRKKK